MDGRNVWVVKFCEEQSFIAKAPARFLVFQHAGRQNFERHVAVELFIVCAINLAHSARAYFFDDAIMAQRPANHVEGDICVAPS